MTKKDYPEWYKESHDIEAAKRSNRVALAYLLAIVFVALLACWMIGTLWFG